MKKVKTIITLIGVSVILFSCGNNSSSSNTEGSNIEQTNLNSEEIKIGTQIWAKKNLDVSTFRNGDGIPEAKTKEEWTTVGNSGKSAWCYYDNDSANGEIYGKLYNWYAVNDPRGLAPVGWHVPNKAEWTTLIDNLGGESEAGTKMKSTSRWLVNGNGTNTSGFVGLPSGFRFYYGDFNGIGGLCYFWSSTEGNNFELESREGYVSIGKSDNNNIKQDGFSVRCVKD